MNDAKVVSQYPSRTMTDMFGDLNKNIETIKLAAVALGMQIMGEKFNKALDILLAHKTIKKSYIKALKKQNIANLADIERQVKELAEKRDKEKNG